MPSIWMNVPSQHSGCTYHRSLLPARYCQGEVAKRGWDLLPGEGLPQGHDVYYCHGLLLPQLMLELGRRKYEGAKVVWSVDDDWKTILPSNPAFPGELGMGAYELLKQLADYVVVSTPALAATFSDVKHKVLTAPNLLDLSIFPHPPTTESDGKSYVTIQPKLPVRVVFAGGLTHDRDLEVLTEVLDKFLDKFAPDRAVVVYFGMSPAPKLMRKYLYRGLFHQPSVPLTGYQQVLNSIDPHVYLCPLEECEFNLSKSAIRVYESWALCAAPVATDFGEYACIQNGKDGRKVHTPDAWESALHRMVTDHEFRIECAGNGRERVEAEYNWHSPQAREPWVRLFETITGGVTS